LNDSVLYIDRDFQFFTPIDIIATVFGFIFLLILVYSKKRRNEGLDYYKYYPSAFLFKTFFVFANCLFYIIVYKGGGDSIGYWDGAAKLNNLFWVDPFAYFREIFSEPVYGGHAMSFNSVTGFPDAKIYGEPASFFVSKVGSIFTFFPFKGYLFISLIFSFIATNASWKLFELVRSYKLHSDLTLAFAFLFIPSLSFWCGGISKDSIIWISLCYFLVNLYRILSPEYRSSFLNWLSIFICLYIMYRVRPFMLLVVIAPLLFAYSARVKRIYINNGLRRIAIRMVVFIITFSGLVVFMQSTVADEFINEAAIINDDMTNNKSYGSNKYDLGVTDYSLAGMAKAAPASIIAGVYRPFIWESLSVSLILNGIESMILIYLTIKFLISGALMKKIKRIQSHEFLIFAFFFTIILAYFAGFTSILFGVLVRFKAPLIPFLIVVLTAYWQGNSNKNFNTEVAEKAS
jgi:hypothetical protein